MATWYHLARKSAGDTVLSKSAREQCNVFPPPTKTNIFCGRKGKQILLNKEPKTHIMRCSEKTKFAIDQKYIPILNYLFLSGVLLILSCQKLNRMNWETNENKNTLAWKNNNITCSSPEERDKSIWKAPSIGLHITSTISEQFFCMGVRIFSKKNKT